MTSAATAWNLLFRVEGGVAPAPGRAPVLATPSGQASGWAGGAGPGVEWKHWPRSTVTGLPMMHAVTLWLPEDFKRQGSQFAGVAFFAGEGQFAADPASGDATSEDPFLRDLAEAVEHPGLRRRRDIIDGEFALLWLTAEELAAGPTQPRDDLRRTGEWVDESEGCNAWDNQEPTTDVWLIPRVDPNAGLAPQEVHGEAAAENGYSNPWDDKYQLRPWAAALSGMSHLGGTAFPVQAMPEGLTPWYLELEEIVGLNFGGGNAQIDLESETFDWAC